MKVTLPLVTGVAPTFTDAVNVTLSPYVDVFETDDDVTVVMVLALAVKVAVIAGGLPVTAKLQGVPVLLQPVMFDEPDHPLKEKPALAMAVNVPVALLL